MESVSEVLLILILLASSSEAEHGAKLAKELQSTAKVPVKVLVGKDALTALEKFGVGRKDLLASPAIGGQLTKHKKELIVLHVEEHNVRGDNDLDCRLWFNGRRERIGGIAGEGGDTFPFLRRGVLELIGDRLGGQATAGVAATADLPQLVKMKEWARVLTVLAAKPELSPKDHYYKVLAYARLGQRQAAITAFTAMQKAHGQHFLVSAAQEQLPAPSWREQSKELPDDDGSRALIDVVAPDTEVDLGKSQDASTPEAAKPEETADKPEAEKEAFPIAP